MEDHFAGRMPEREGVSGYRLDNERVQLSHELRFTQAAGLVELSSDYVFFTTALLFSHGSWTHDPLEDYLKENPGSCLFTVELPKPFLGGEGLAVFEMQVCPRPFWQDLWNYLITLGGINWKERTYHRMLPQAIPVPDILALERLTYIPKPLPKVNIITLGLDANWGQVYVEPARNPPLDTAWVRKGPPDLDTVRLAEAVFVEHPKPFEAMEQAETRDD